MLTDWRGWIGDTGIRNRTPSLPEARDSGRSYPVLEIQPDPRNLGSRLQEMRAAERGQKEVLDAMTTVLRSGTSLPVVGFSERDYFPPTIGRFTPVRGMRR